MDKFIYCIIEFISAIFGMFILTLSLISLRDYHFNSNMINTYKENWEKGPISEIIASSLSTGCPESHEPLITDAFPGHLNGCDCFASTSESFSEKVFPQNCTKAQLKAKCTVITESFNQTLNNWQGVNLCIKRVYSNFYSMKSLVSTAVCPMGKQSCGAFDSTGNVYCVDIGVKCPLNYLEIVRKDSRPSLTSSGIAIMSIPLADRYTLYYSNENKENGKLLINLRANTHPMCYQPNEGMFGQNNFTLNRYQGYDACVTSNREGVLYDPRYTLINTENESKFYFDNKIDPQSLSLVSTVLKRASPNLINLYSTNYFGWKHSCYDKTLEQFSLEALVLPNVAYNFLLIYLIGIIAVIYYIFFIAMFALIMMLEDSKQKDVFWVMVAGIEICLLLTLLALSFVVIYKTMILLQPYKMFKTLSCAEEITMHAFDEAYSKIERVIQYLIPFATFTLLDICARVTYYAYLFLIRK